MQVIFFLQKMVIYRTGVDNLLRTTNTVALGPEPTGAPTRGSAVPEQPVSRLAQYIGSSSAPSASRNHTCVRTVC